MTDTRLYLGDTMLQRKRVVVQSYKDKDTNNVVYVPYTEIYYISLV
jgi:hypothetical protein